MIMKVVELTKEERAAKKAELEGRVKKGRRIVEGTYTKELQAAQKALTDSAKNYGQVETKNFFGIVTGREGLFQFIENPQTLQLILSDDRITAITGAKESAQKAVTKHEEEIKRFNGVIAARSREEQIPENVAAIKELKVQKEALEKALPGEKKWLADLTALQTLLDSKDPKLANWSKVDADKESLKEKLAKIQKSQETLNKNAEKLANLQAELAVIKAEIEKREAVINAVKTIANVMNELIPFVKDAITDPYKFSIVKILKDNIPTGKGIESISAIGVVNGVVNDPSSKLGSLGFSAIGTITPNLLDVIKIGINIPSLLKGELGDKIEDPNALLQSDFMEKFITDPALYDMLSKNADNFGQIIWNFQNDLVALIGLIAIAPEEESKIAPETLLKLVGHLLHSPKQLEAIASVVSKNIPIFQKMFTDEQSAFYKLAKDYGVKDPQVIATLIPALLKIVEIIPSQHSYVKAIFEKVSETLLNGEEVTLPKIIEIANLVTPILKSSEFKGALIGIFAPENSQALITIVKYGLTFLAKSPLATLFPEGMLDGIRTLITPENISLIQNILKGALDMIPGLIEVMEKYEETFEKIRKIEEFQAQLENPQLSIKERLGILEESKKLKFQTEDLSELSKMGLELLQVVAEYRSPFDKVRRLRTIELELEKASVTDERRAALIKEGLELGFTAKEMAILDNGHPKLSEIISKYKELFEKIKEKPIIHNLNFQAYVAILKVNIEKDRNASKVDLEREPIPGFPDIKAPALVNQFMGLTQNEFLKSMIAGFLPQELKGIEAIIPHLGLIGTSLISAILKPEFIDKLIKVVPGNIEKIANGEAYYEPASKILEVFRDFLSSPGFKLAFEQDIVNMIQQNRDVIKGALDELLKSNPAIRRYNIDSNKILNFLTDKDILKDLSEALNDVAQNRFLTRAKGVAKIARIALGSTDTLSLLFNIIIDSIVAFVRENVLPDRMKRWISGADIETVLVNAVGGSKDLAAACKDSYAEQETFLSSFLLRTQNFSGQNINLSLEGFKIDNFNFKGANFKVLNESIINLKGAEITHSNMSFNLSEGQKVDLSGATIDMQTLKSMMPMFEAGKVEYKDMKLSIPSHKEALEFIANIKKPDLQQYLQNNENCVVKRMTHAEKVKAEAEKPEARGL